MPTYLHQILAVDRGVEADEKRITEEVRRVFTIGGDRDPLTGLSRTHQSRNPEKWPDLPPETRRVQVTAADLLSQVYAAMTRLYDVKYTREAGNARAAADLIVDGETLLTGVPAGYLLFLEGRILSLINTLIDPMPVRNPAEDWHDQATDPNLPRGVWASEPRLTPSTTMEPTPLVGYDATEHQPAQIRWLDANVNTGTRTTVSYSGQLSVQDVQAMRERATKILTAVRYAREKANMLEVENQQAGAVILGRIFGDLIPSA
jgi:hypothetical protein